MFLAEQTAAAAVPAIYKSLAAGNTWLSLAPEMLVALLSLVALVGGMILKKREAWLTPALIKFALLLITGLSFALLFRTGGATLNETDLPFGGLLRRPDWFTDVARIFFLVSAFCVTQLISVYLRASRLAHHEYYHLTLVATAAMMLLVQANHFVLFFMALETIAVTLYVLVGYNRNSAASLEAGVKYLVTGALSSAFLLAGIVLLYGMGGSATPGLDMLRFDHLAGFVASHENLALVKVAVMLVLGGVAFKVGAFPFNVWIPDVYQGAPAPTASFLATASKGAGVFALVMLTALDGSPFVGMRDTLVNVLVPVTALTLLLGNIPALGQLKVKRLLGLSGISHAGFLLMGVIAAIMTNPDTAAHDLARVAIVVYLFAYLFASTLVFSVITHVAGEDDAGSTITDYKGLYKRNPIVAFFFAIGLGSLAGIPPTFGFVAKLLILIAAFQAELYGLLAVAFVCLVMGMYYYLGWLREAFHRVDSEVATKPINVCIRSKIILGAISLLLLFGFAAQLLFKFELL